MKSAFSPALAPRHLRPCAVALLLIFLCAACRDADRPVYKPVPPQTARQPRGTEPGQSVARVTDRDESSGITAAAVTPQPRSTTTTVAPLPEPAVKIVPRERVLFSFESSADERGWSASYTAAAPRVVIDKAFASGGSGSLAFDLDAGRTYPGVALATLRGGIFDWSAADSLRFEIFHPGSRPLGMFIRIDGDGPAGPTTWTGEFSLAPGLNPLRFPLRNLKFTEERVDPARIRQLIIFAIDPAQTQRLYLDQFRLELPARLESPVDNVFLFDFGTTALAGFTAVSADDAAGPGRPWGFAEPRPRNVDAEYRLDPLADSWVEPGPSGKAEFRIDLPDGRYTVAMFLHAMDAFDLATRGFSVIANGKLRIKQGTSAMSFYSTRGFFRGFDADYPGADPWEAFAKDHAQLFTFDVDVPDGALAVSFDCSACAMMIWPAGPPEWGARLVEQVQRIRRDEFHRLNFRLAEPPAAPPSAATPPSARCLMAPVPLDHDTPPSFVPAGDAASLEIRAARGEWEAAVLAFRPDADYCGVRVTVSDLAGPAGVVPASAAEVFIAKLFPSGGRGVYVFRPRMLEPAGGQTLRAGVTREIWIDVRVPDDAAPGDYAGRLVIEAEGRQPAEAGVRLAVRPFRLVDDLPVNLGMFYSSPALMKRHFDAFHGPWSPQWKAAIDAELRNMRDHGFNSITFPGPQPLTIRDDGIDLDFTLCERFLELCRANGIGVSHPVILSTIEYANYLINRGRAEFSPEFNRAFCGTMRSIIDWAREHRLPLLLFVMDEVRESQFNPWNRNLAATLRYAELVHSVPGAVTFGTVMADRHEGRDYAPLAGKIDVLSTHPWAKSQKLIAGARKLSLYNAGLDRLSWGLGLWRIGAVDRRQWAYQYVNLPFNPVDHRNFAIAWPSPAGLLPGVEEKRIREGVDDYRYLATLQARVADAKAAGRDVSAAAGLLAELRAALPEYPHDTAPGLDLDAWRDRLADEIAKLGGK